MPATKCHTKGRERDKRICFKNSNPITLDSNQSPTVKASSNEGGLSANKPNSFLEYLNLIHSSSKHGPLERGTRTHIKMDGCKTLSHQNWWLITK